ncbi:uncharacterized protein LOC111715528 isoform X2 [Eurytemora carolleeae]|uniref:uncharacterized protein LOC111715528 isoform X2 n=1 Tax=Eurytemora carolleeae TaxID=1294199 RepID=UPI000C763CDB|nr:uncharacterized protein LOC111715528 isoform X2 [Eurytemora carolleeae]|eukprot:XP_023346632.1 uncharacterized protein LOC111715528 isoform X2 [Eurytemora affinis]
MDSTIALLEDTVCEVPSTPDLVDSVAQDDSEDEVFFGTISEKEMLGHGSKYNKRRTISDTERRRSYEVLKSKPQFSSLGSLGSNSSNRSSLYTAEHSIVEEDEDNDEEDEEEGVDLINTSQHTEKENLNPGEFVTGRNFRRSGRSPLCSLPSASKLDQVYVNRKESNEGEIEFHSKPMNTTPAPSCSTTERPAPTCSTTERPASTCSTTERPAPTCSTTDSFALGSIATAPGFSTNNFVLGSIGSLVGDCMYSAGSTDRHPIPGEYDQHISSDLSQLTIGDDSVFTRVSMDTGDTTTTSSFTLGYIGSVSEPSEADSPLHKSNLTVEPADLENTIHSDSVSDSIKETTTEPKEDIELLPVQNLEEGVVMDQDDSKPSKTVTPEAPTIILVTPSLSEDPEFKMGSGNHSKESQEHVDDPEVQSGSPKRDSSLDITVDPAWLEDTEVEKIMFDMLGPEYDEIVEKMTKKELCDLKYKIDNLTNDERREIDKRLQQMIDEEENSLCSRRASSMYGRKFSLGGLNSPRHSSLSGLMSPCQLSVVSNLSRQQLSVGSTISPFSLSSETSVNSSTVSPTCSINKPSMEQDTSKMTEYNLVNPVEIRFTESTASARSDQTGDLNAGKSGALSRPVKSDFSSDNDYITAESDYPGDESETEKRSTDYYETSTNDPTDNETETDEPAETETSGNYSACTDTTTEPVFRPSRVSVVPVHDTDTSLYTDSDYQTYSESEIIQREEGLPNYLMPTYSSIQKCSPQKPCRSPLKPWIPPSPQKMFTNPSVSPSMKPVSRLLFKPELTPSKGLRLSPGRQGTPGFSTPSSKYNPVFKTPQSSAKSRIPHLKGGLGGPIASPIGEYIRNNPVPHLVQNVRAKDVKADLESTLMEPAQKQQENKFPSLPCATYTAAKLAQDTEYDMTGKDYEIHKAYGQEQTLVKITRHIERARVPLGLSWDNDQLVNLDSCNSSPSLVRGKLPVKSLLKRTQRNSGLFDESMLDVSLHQTEVIFVANNDRHVADDHGRSRSVKTFSLFLSQEVIC